MAKFSEMRPLAQWSIAFAVAAVITLALYLSVFKGIDDKNKADITVLNDKQAEIAQLRPYETKLPQLLEQIEALKQQMEIQKKIVPDEKEADKFITLMQETASSSQIAIRRYSSKTEVKKEFYAEVPFEIEVDGPYYALLDFFSRTSKLERIVNIANLKMDSLQSGRSSRVGKYDYNASESVTATCMASTFFSREAESAAAKGPAKPPVQAGAKK